MQPQRKPTLSRSSDIQHRKYLASAANVSFDGPQRRTAKPWSTAALGRSCREPEPVLGRCCAESEVGFEPVADVLISRCERLQHGKMRHHLKILFCNAAAIPAIRASHGKLDLFTEA